MDIWRIRPSGGAPETVTDHGAPVNFVTPLDARTLLFVAPAEDRSGPWLWSLDVQSKQTRRVTTGVEQYSPWRRAPMAGASSRPSRTGARVCGVFRSSIAWPTSAT